MDLGPHAVFIWLCYGAVGLVVGWLVAGLVIDGRRLGRQLADLEARGLGRGASSRTESTRT
jgi:heme exporter protein CcmD